jgi:hypothetical protein
VLVRTQQQREVMRMREAELLLEARREMERAEAERRRAEKAAREAEAAKKDKR